MSTVSILNTDLQISGKTLATTDTAQNITALKTFNLSPSAPFAVQASSASVTNLDADKVDGHHAADFLLLTGGTMVGDLLFTDATYDIGKTGATRPRDGFFSRNVEIGGTVKLNGLTYTWPASQTANYFLQTNGSGALTWTNALGPLTLLHQASGTDSTTTATNVDTYALASQLAIDDALLVTVSLQTTTQNTAQVSLYNSTDSVTIQNLTLSPFTTTVGSGYWESRISQTPASATKIQATRNGADFTNSASYADGTGSTFVTAWTGAWTIALRHGGVTSGGTFTWRWRIFKIKGT